LPWAGVPPVRKMGRSGVPSGPEQQQATETLDATVPDRPGTKLSEEANVGAGLWKGVGMWAWILFRISGLILVGYLFVHIVVVSQGQISGAGALDRLFETFDKPIMVFLDFMLVSAVLYHGLNGVRVVLMDMGIGIRRHKAVFLGVMIVAGGLLAWFAIVAAPYIF
jgi:succinate dehydrogenase / fumarate reductase, cytochrome b subunit